MKQAALGDRACPATKVRPDPRPAQPGLISWALAQRNRGQQDNLFHRVAAIGNLLRLIRDRHIHSLFSFYFSLVNLDGNCPLTQLVIVSASVKLKCIHTDLVIQCDRRFKARWFDREYGAIDLVQDCLCGIAHDETPNTGTCHRPHDDKIRIDTFG